MPSHSQYFRTRAAEERQRAAEASHEASRTVHLEIADCYEAKALECERMEARGMQPTIPLSLSSKQLEDGA